MKRWQTKQLAQPQVCTTCGKTPLHGRMHCLVICHGCGKRGHYKSMCKSKPQSGHSSIRTVHVDSDVFLGTIHSDMDAISAEGIPWTTNITLNNRNLEFKIETGANVTIIPEADYRKDQGG